MGRSRDCFGASESENALVFVREDLDEPRLRVGSMLENPGGARAACKVAMTLEEATDAVYVFS